MQNLHDRNKLSEAEELAFVESCKAEFIEKSLAATNAKQVKLLTAVSFLPNVISAVTAGFFVLYLLQSYPRVIALLLGAVLFVVVLAVEVGKRALIGGISKTYFTAGKVAILGIVALCVLIAVSMGASYMGGKALIVETAAPPEKAINPEIAALEAQLATQQETIGRLQKTTWKGKVTVDATKGITAAKKIEAGIIERMNSLKAADDLAHADQVAKQSGQRLNFGYLLGILAAVADLFLLGLLFTAKRLRYEVAAINYNTMRNAMSTHQSKYLTNAGEITVPPASFNEVAPRRPIGFHKHAEEEAAHAMSVPDTRNECTEDDTRNAWSEDTRNEWEEGHPEYVEIIKPVGKVRACSHCGEIFSPRTSWQKYCTPECRVEAWEKRTGKKWNFKPQKH